MLRLLNPDLRVESVLALDPPRLRALDIASLLLDVDCTLKRYSEPEPPPPARAWLETLRTEGFGMCLVSNGRSARLKNMAEALALPLVTKAMKPFPYACRSAMRRLGFDARSTAIVGDQIFADVMAGRLAGIRTILVQPIHPEEEPWFTRLKRPWERLVLARLDRKEPAAANNVKPDP
jgi:uncharacterized protein